MSQTIISEWADAQKTQERIDASPELAKLAHEFCKRFGVKVGVHPTLNRLTVYTPSGLQAGQLIISEAFTRERKKVPLYLFNSPIIDKQKGSANSNRDSRDSTKITGLLKSIEKNNEQPTDEKLYKQYLAGIGYAFSQLQSNRMRTHVSLDYDLVISMFRKVSNSDYESISLEERKQMEEVLAMYDKNVADNDAKNSLVRRFAKGCSLIGWSDEGNYYLVGKVRYDGQRSSFDGIDRDCLVIEGLTRHENIESTPHVGLAVMLKEYFKTKPMHDARNAFGYRRHDAYHEDVDVSCGYAGTEIAWMIIPDEAPTV